VNVIVYHGGCFDGFGAAWVASHALPGPCTYIPAINGEPVDIQVTPADALYIMDFSFPRSRMLELAGQAKRLVVLDHHKSAQAQCAGLDFCHFDMARSGAGITWDYFHPGVPRPKLVAYVEDQDLWRQALSESEAIHAWIASHPKDFATWDALAEQLETDFDACLAEGRAILRYRRQVVAEIASQARLVDISGHQVPLVNCNYQFGSDVAHSLLEAFPEAPFAAYWVETRTGDQRFGLRGRDFLPCPRCQGEPGGACDACEGSGRVPDPFDVCDVALGFGGGGHQKAAGFEVPSDVPSDDLLTP
jgi:hypothetical protein